MLAISLSLSLFQITQTNIYFSRACWYVGIFYRRPHFNRWKKYGLGEGQPLSESHTAWGGASVCGMRTRWSGLDLLVARKEPALSLRVRPLCGRVFVPAG